MTPCHTNCSWRDPETLVTWEDQNINSTDTSLYWLQLNTPWNFNHMNWWMDNNRRIMTYSSTSTLTAVKGPWPWNIRPMRWKGYGRYLVTLTASSKRTLKLGKVKQVAWKDNDKWQHKTKGRVENQGCTTCTELPFSFTPISGPYVTRLTKSYE